MDSRSYRLSTRHLRLSLPALCPHPILQNFIISQYLEKET